MLETTFEGVSAHVTSPTRTVADCFRFERLVGPEVAMEALQDGLRHGTMTVAQLSRVEEVLPSRRLRAALGGAREARSSLTLSGSVPILVTRISLGTSRDHGMHVITRTRLLEFGAKHPDAAQPLLDWERIVRRKQYRNTAQVLADFPSVDFIGKGRAVFDICGNSYRLVVKMDFRGRGLVLVRHVVTHKEYDRLIVRRLL